MSEVEGSSTGRHRRLSEWLEDRGRGRGRTWRVAAAAFDRALVSPQPEEIPEPGPLYDQRKSQHDAMSKTIRGVFYGLVLTCLFCVVTLGGASDAELLAPQSTVKLPGLDFDLGFGTFLLVGPLLLVVLVSYLHIFVAEHRQYPVSEGDSQPMLPNFGSVAARATVVSVYYGMVPATLVAFAWKAHPKPLVGPALTYLGLLVSAVLVVLLVRRSGMRWQWRAVVPLGLAAAVAYLAVVDVPIERRVNLSRAELCEKDLRFTNLQNAFMREAALSQANLSGANLAAATLVQANATGAEFINTDLSGAFLDEAHLAGANLYNATLTGAYMSKADLRGATLFGANLAAATLVQADLRAADLTYADLSGANLVSADLRGAIFANSGFPAEDRKAVIDTACRMLKSAWNWQDAYRDTEFACDEEIPPPPAEQQRTESVQYACSPPPEPQ